MSALLKLIVSIGLVAASCAFAATVEASAVLELRDQHLTLGLDRAGRGGLVSLRAATGREFIAASSAPALFALTFSRRAASPGERFTVSSRDAREFTADREEDSRRQLVTLRYSRMGEWPVQVTCTASLATRDPLVRWRISVRVPEGLVLESVRFPIITLRVAADGEDADDALVLGSTKGGVIRHLSAMKTGTTVAIGQPGSMAAQFGCHYTPSGGVLTAAFDGQGYPKTLSATRTTHGVELAWLQAGFATGEFRQDYDVILATFAGANGRPTDWRDAADIYKTWALTQPWCATTYERRTDLPTWIKQGPAMVRFGRDWLVDPARIERWTTEYWCQKFPETPLIVALWGWEKIGTWVAPDYFPVFPSDAEFSTMLERLRATGAHAFPWPSGYHWTLTYQKKPEGGFAWDDRTRFAALAGSHAVQTRSGQRYVRTPSWLAGGDTTCLCGGDPWTWRWWNEEICVPLARRGCELIQVDQVVGGSFPACYDASHPHPPGPGRWQTESFARQLETMRVAMREIQRDSVVCFEEPNEWFNHLVGLQDYRDCESPHEWASVFNYLYHEYLPPFQSNPRGDDPVVVAHCLVDGQLPHLVPKASDLGVLLPVNGGFEPSGRSAQALAGWDQVHGYQGVAWTGKALSDSGEKHGGSASLRLENVAQAEIVQISQNVKVGAVGQGAGIRYRLSGWFRTENMAKPNAVMVGLFGPGMRSLGGGVRLPFPKAGVGWQRVAADFAIPAGAETLRIMIHMDGPAIAWVDDLVLEEVLPDRSARPAQFHSGDLLTQRWVELYHGEGRPWLQFGKILHPPKLGCANVSYQALIRQGTTHTKVDRNMPAVLHNAFVAPDGTEAVVLANTTREPQKVTLEWKGTVREFTLAASDARIVR